MSTNLVPVPEQLSHLKFGDDPLDLCGEKLRIGEATNKKIQEKTCTKNVVDLYCVAEGVDWCVEGVGWYLFVSMWMKYVCFVL